ncbi:ABC transporter substrate-binding protein [Halorarius litoreus]|uniref:ABC transporter substrate-binding protein n=1 Tax=Halorarius litoreus TaxID=2962676 RepID=UPI0020CC4366|nr:ABC transporter substrate-binding protein [Halorarius litoreus]
MSRGVEGSRRSESAVRTNRRRFLQSTAGGVAVGLAGCTSNGNGNGNGGDGGDGGDGGGDGPTEDGGTDTPQRSSPIKLGVLAPLPDNTSFGEAMADSVRLMATQLNNDGGLLGVDVEVVVKDTELSPDTARQAYRELILQDEVDATFGVFSSESHLAIIDDIAQQQTVHVAGGTGTTQLNQLVRDDYESYKYWFRNLQNGDIQGMNQGLFAQEQFDDIGWSDIALLVEDIEGYKSYASGFRANLPDSVTIQVDENFAAGTEDYRPLFRRAENNDVDAVWIYASVTGATAVNQWSRSQADFELGGVLVAASNPNFYRNVDGAQYTVTAIVGGTPAYRPTEMTTAFIEAYQAEFDKLPPDYTGYTTYDAVLAWVTAVQEVGTTDADTVVPALENVSYTGTMGTVEYYPRDHKWAHDVKYGEGLVVPPVVQWQAGDGPDGKQALLWPESVDTDAYQAPPWVSR